MSLYKNEKKQWDRKNEKHHVPLQNFNGDKKLKNMSLYKDEKN
jgi:hypothetical protein